MKDISAGLKYNNYIGSRKIRSLFKGMPYELKVKDIDVNGQKRGCSGFIQNTQTGKVCYITTETFFDRRCGSGLYGSNNKAVMMRTAASTKDFTGGANQWLPISEIVTTAERLTM